MDALAALKFSAVIALNLEAVGITEESAVRRGTIRAGFIAGGMLLVVYAMLTHIGGISGAAFPAATPVPPSMTALADGLFGRVGQVLLAAIFVIACFNTCVGLIASVGEYFHELLPQLPLPRHCSLLRADEHAAGEHRPCGHPEPFRPGAERHLPHRHHPHRGGVPARRFQRTSVWRLSILFTAIQSIPAALPFGPLSTLMNALPLSSPSALAGCCRPLIGIGAGLLM